MPVIIWFYIIRGHFDLLGENCYYSFYNKEYISLVMRCYVLSFRIISLV